MAALPAGRRGAASACWRVLRAVVGSRAFGGLIQPQRQAEREGAADAGNAVETDLAAHQREQLARDGEAKTAAAEAARDRVVGLGEGGKNLGLLFRGDADAGIAHGKGQLDRRRAGGSVIAGSGRRRGAVARHADADLDLAAAGELDGVADQIDQHLTQAYRIAQQRVGRSLGKLPVQTQSLLAGTQRQRAQTAAEQFAQAERRLLDFQTPGLDFRKIEDVVDDHQQRVGRETHHLQIIALLVVEAGVEQQVGHADDAVHRRAQFVAHRREKRALGAIGRLGRFARVLQLDFDTLVAADVAEHPQPAAAVLGARHFRKEEDRRQIEFEDAAVGQRQFEAEQRRRQRIARRQRRETLALAQALRAFVEQRAGADAGEFGADHVDAEEIAQRLVGNDDEAVFVLEQNAGGHALDQRRQARSGRQQLRLVAPALADVLKNRDIADVALAVEHRRRHQRHRKARSVAADEGVEIGAEHLAHQHRRVQRTFLARHRQAAGRMRMNGVVHVATENLVARPAEQAFALGIEEGAAAVGVAGDDALAERFGNAVNALHGSPGPPLRIADERASASITPPRHGQPLARSAIIGAASPAGSASPASSRPHHRALRALPAAPANGACRRHSRRRLPPPAGARARTFPYSLFPIPHSRMPPLLQTRA